MAIEKFTTRSLIINQYANGEHDTALKVYTEDFGLIVVLAKSLRKREGKLKAHVRKFHYANLTIIKGKEIYRLVGATEILLERKRDTSLMVKFTNDIKIKNEVVKKQNLIAEVSKLVERMYGGEIKQPSLFNKIFNYISHYYETENNSRDYSLYRAAIYATILIELGHMDANVLGVRDINEYKNMSIEILLLNTSLYRSSISRELHKSIKESML